MRYRRRDDFRGSVTAESKRDLYSAYPVRQATPLQFVDVLEERDVGSEGGELSKEQRRFALASERGCE